MQSSKLSVLAAGAALVVAISAPSFSAEEMKAMKQENAVFMQVEFVKFKPGMRQAAMEHIDKYFVPASKKAGTAEPWVLHFDSGPWDAAYFWDLKGGYSELEWEMTPDGIKWWKALADLNGGDKGAEKVMMDFQNMIAKEIKDIGHHHMMEGE